MLKKIINTGIYPELSFKEQSKIRIFNTACIVVSAILIFYSFIAVKRGLYLISAICLLEVILFVFNLWFIHHRKYYSSYHFGMIHGMIFIFIFSLLLGETNQSHLYYFFMPLAAMTVFDNKQINLFYFIFSMGLLVVTLFIYEHFKPYYDISVVSEVFGFSNILSAGLLIFLVIKLFKDENITFNEKITQQKILLENKNKDITDSITYAKRIQSALLFPKEEIRKYFPDSFIIYWPKDIVSGDFYFFAHPKTHTRSPSSPEGEQEESITIAAVDCTGHGVPGAFMSVIGNNFLNEIINDKNITDTAKILNLLHEKVTTTLFRESGSSQDGMDIAIMNINRIERKVQFSGAIRPLWYFSSNTLHEIRGDRFSIGGIRDFNNFFSSHEIVLKEKTSLYIFSDGFADQFGLKNKKMMTKRFKEELISIQNNTMEVQEKYLEEFFVHWKGIQEQTDDVPVIGIRI